MENSKHCSYHLPREIALRTSLVQMTYIVGEEPGERNPHACEVSLLFRDRQSLCGLS